MKDHTNPANKNNAPKMAARISKATSARNPEVVKAVYEDWAQDYDLDLASSGYVAPKIAVETLIDLLPAKQSVIYDAGCGTGLIGQRLQQAGYGRLHGADFSAEMLERAKSTGAYEALELSDYSRPLPQIAGQTFDGVISVGVYCAGFRDHFLTEMLRVLKPGGVLVFTAREHFYDGEIKDELTTLTRGGSIADLSVSRQPYIEKQGIDAYYIVARKADHFQSNA